MNMFDDCLTEVVIVTGAVAAGGAVRVDWPDPLPMTELWEVLNATIWHDDSVPLTGHWELGDGAATVQCGDDIVVAVGAREPLYTVEFPRGVTLSLLANTLSFVVPVGATDGALLTLDIVGRVVRGIA